MTNQEYNQEQKEKVGQVCDSKSRVGTHGDQEVGAFVFLSL